MVSFSLCWGKENRGRGERELAVQVWGSGPWGMKHPL